MKYTALMALSHILLIVMLSSPGAPGAEEGKAVPRKQAVLHGNGSAGPYNAGFRFVEGIADVDTALSRPSDIAVSAMNGIASLETNYALPAFLLK